jgi:hypothetical protein
MRKNKALLLKSPLIANVYLRSTNQKAEAGGQQVSHQPRKHRGPV